jgi:rhamnogalacturonyl hydrolase YesR
MAATLKACQQADGFWRTNLTDPQEYTMKESSGTAFMTYGISWGINNGILPKQDYLPTAKERVGCYRIRCQSRR